MNNERDIHERYVGRPLLRLLDCYILALTGNLAPDTEDAVATAVRRLFRGDDNWKEALRKGIGLPDGFDERVKALWRSQPEGVDPLAFAVAVSDANFKAMLDPS
jgi:hypothetical protein